jgi:elongation factor 1-gamma
LILYNNNNNNPQTQHSSKMSFKLYAFPNYFRTQKIQIVAKYANIELELPPFEFGKDNKTEAFGQLTPLRKVPVLQTPDGAIFESNAITRYLARRGPAGLCGSNAYETGLVDQWMDFSNNEVEPARNAWYSVVKGYLAPNPKVVTEARKDLENALKALDIYLLQHTFVAGNAITAADISLFSALVEVFGFLMGTKSSAQYPNVLRWFNTILYQPNVKAVFTQFSFAKEDAQIPKAAKKEEKPKEAAAAKPAPVAKPVAAAEDDEDKPAPKPKNPLDSLPESSMVLDTIKKLAFSQRPILPDFFEKLWPQFDANGYSWYTCHYNYNDENKVYFMTGNAVGGFIQRSDACRKYALGVMNIAGKDEETGPYKITGAWLFRGPKVIDEMVEENPDSEYYTWSKVDISTDEGKQIVKDQFMATHLNGEEVLDRRYFK